MRKLKRIMALAVVMTMVFATTAFAQEPREILSHAYAASMEATTSSIAMSIVGSVHMGGQLLADVNMEMLIDSDIDLEAGTMRMFMRMPMQLTIVDPLSGAVEDVETEIAVFMDGDTLLVYESNIGVWFTDPSMDMGDLDAMFAIFGDMGDMTDWMMDINEQVLDEITIQFADEQVDGFYVIEQFMDWNDLVNMMDAIFAGDMFAEIFAAVPEVDMAEFDAIMGELADILEQADINLDMVFRSYINQETLEFDIYGMVADLDFDINVDLPIIGALELSGSFVIDMVVDYNPTIEWPVIDEVLTLDELWAMLGITQHTFEFDASMLEERVSLTLSDANSAIIELAIVDDYNLNVFVRNNGDDVIVVIIDDTHFEIVLPGQAFVAQLPSGTAGAGMMIAGDSAFDAEVGLRLTNNPL